MVDKLHMIFGLLLQIAIVHSTDTTASSNEKSERSGRAWHHAPPGLQTLQQHQQNQPPVFLQTSTNQPPDNSPPSHQLDPNGSSRNFEEQDKAMPSASEQDFLSRHYGFFNVHRFDPNFPYFDRPQYHPRYPSPHMPRFGPGYRKDKYGHGYGYSCKQGDDCDEVRAANQIPAMPPPMPPHAPHHNPSPFGNHYPDLPPLPSMPSFSNMPSFNLFPGPYPGQPPARFNDMHAGMPPQMPHHQMPQYQMPPSRYYHARYLHDEAQEKGETVDTKTE